MKSPSVWLRTKLAERRKAEQQKWTKSIMTVLDAALAQQKNMFFEVYNMLPESQEKRNMMAQYKRWLRKASEGMAKDTGLDDLLEGAISSDDTVARAEWIQVYDKVL